MRLLQATLVAGALALAVAVGWLVGDTHTPAKGLAAGFAVVVVFGMGLVWAACDVAVDDRKRPPP